MIPLHDDNPTELTPLFTIAFIGACSPRVDTALS
jgi:hypothetical protein